MAQRHQRRRTARCRRPARASTMRDDAARAARSSGTSSFSTPARDRADPAQRAAAAPARRRGQLPAEHRFDVGRARRRPGRGWYSSKVERRARWRADRVGERRRAGSGWVSSRIFMAVDWRSCGPGAAGRRRPSGSAGAASARASSARLSSRRDSLRKLICIGDSTCRGFVAAMRGGRGRPQRSATRSK